MHAAIATSTAAQANSSTANAEHGAVEALLAATLMSALYVSSSDSDSSSDDE